MVSIIRGGYQTGGSPCRFSRFEFSDTTPSTRLRVYNRPLRRDLPWVIVARVSLALLKV
jgi:hypothetical protein